MRGGRGRAEGRPPGVVAWAAGPASGASRPASPGSRSWLRGEVCCLSVARRAGGGRRGVCLSLLELEHSPQRQAPMSARSAQHSLDVPLIGQGVDVRARNTQVARGDLAGHVFVRRGGGAGLSDVRRGALKPSCRQRRQPSGGDGQLGKTPLCAVPVGSNRATALARRGQAGLQGVLQLCLEVDRGHGHTGNRSQPGTQVVSDSHQSGAQGQRPGNIHLRVLGRGQGGSRKGARSGGRVCRCAAVGAESATGRCGRSGFQWVGRHGLKGGQGGETEQPDKCVTLQKEAGGSRLERSGQPTRVGDWRVLVFLEAPMYFWCSSTFYTVFG